MKTTSPPIEVCRLCLTDNSFFTDLTEIRGDFPVSVIVMVVCPVKVDLKDSLPKQICEECLEIVMSAYKLRDQSITSDLKLREIAGKQTSEQVKKSPFDPLIKQERPETDEHLVICHSMNRDHEDSQSDAHFGDFDRDFKFSSSTCELIKEQSPSTSSAKKRRKSAHKSDGSICYICSKTFKSERELNKHLAVHQDKTYQCPICPSKFYYPERLKGHMKIHDPKHKFRFQCDNCGEFFAWKKAMMNHVLKAHMGVTELERKYHCSYCSAGFRYKYNLKVHMVTHTGEVSFI
jgi:uncharacterized C2H2 Zn-finger protein